MFRVVLGVTFAAAMASSAVAADLVLDEPALQAAMAPAWDGAYLGLQIGAVAGAFDDTFPPAPLAESDGDLAGGQVGIYGGWNAQIDAVVVGIDGDLNYSNVQGSSGNLGGDTVDVNIRWSGAIRGRAGIAADNLLFYVAGGLAAARGELAITDLAALPVTTADDVLLGWTLGGGVEMAFDENWVGRLDYRYSDYGSLDYVVDGIDHGSMAVTTHALTLGVAYRF